MSNFAGYDLSDISQKKDLLQELFSDPTLLPDSIKSWLPNYLGTNPPDIPIDNVVGFQQNAVTSAPVINAVETVQSVPYKDLTTVGPTLTGLSDGTYVVVYGCAAMISTGNSRARANISLNGALPDDTVTPQIYTQIATGMVGLSTSTVVRLSAGLGNSIKLQYSSGALTSATATFDRRYLSATRIAG